MTLRTFRSFATVLSLAVLVPAVVASCGGPEGEDEEIPEDDGSFDSAYQEGKEDAVRTGRFEVFKGSDGKYYVHLLAVNGQQVLSMQGYTTQANAKKGITSVKANIAADATVEFRTAADGRVYFVVKGSNGEVVASSELYSTRSNADRALTSARSTAATATTVTYREAPAAYQVFKGLDGQYYFHVRAKNGEILVQSEGYASRANAVSGAGSVTTNGTNNANYEVRSAVGGQAYFLVKSSTNSNVLAWSQLYTSSSSATTAKDSFKTLIKSGAVTAAK